MTTTETQQLGTTEGTREHGYKLVSYYDQPAHYVEKQINDMARKGYVPVSHSVHISASRPIHTWTVLYRKDGKP